MKRLLILTIVLFAGVLMGCPAQDNIYYQDTATLIWDAVTEDNDGNPLLPEDVVEYEVYIYDASETIDDQDPANLILVGTTSLTQQEIDFTGLPRAMYYAGVRAKVTDGQGLITYSDISWSYDASVVDPTSEPFAYIPLSGVLVLPAPQGLRDGGM